jgi:hypothetical protein
MSALSDWFEPSQRPRLTQGKQKHFESATPRSQTAARVSLAPTPASNLQFSGRGEVARVGAELGAAIRKVVTRLHRTAPSLEGHPVATIEARLKEEEDDILKQLHTLNERLRPWQQSD